MSNEHNQIFQVLQAAMDNEHPEVAIEGDRDERIHYAGYLKGRADLAKQIIKLITQWGQTNSNNLSSSR